MLAYNSKRNAASSGRMGCSAIAVAHPRDVAVPDVIVSGAQTLWLVTAERSRSVWLPRWFLPLLRERPIVAPAALFVFVLRFSFFRSSFFVFPFQPRGGMLPSSSVERYDSRSAFLLDGVSRRGTRGQEE